MPNRFKPLSALSTRSALTRSATLLGAGCALSLLTQATAVPAVPVTQAGARTATIALGALPGGRAGGPTVRGLTARGTTNYSLLGVSWDDPEAQLAGTVQVRTRSAGRWSGWQDLVADSEDRPDRAEADGPGTRGATAPRWVGPSDGVEVRVTGDGPLPRGLRVDLVDPGTGKPGADVQTMPSDEASASAPDAAHRLARHAGAHQAPRPGIVTRTGWGADESLRHPGFTYTGAVRVVFVHHTDTANDYSCSDSPKVIRAIYQYHVQTNGWNDIGYNFLVDRCGTIYEGRAGGVAQPVLGAHTLGFNADSTGVAALGTFSGDVPPQAQVDGVTKIAAWKLGLTGQDALGTASLTSASDGSRFPAGDSHSFDTISGHRDAFATECPGTELYDRLPAMRLWAAHLQGRR
ncbi:N-acetylmuramoyl-L-alanine amidase [Kitasatospora acidiphila]|uniref:N-acetylmuramoyl-L-alanine amidase n=1 Tax=Kitasatospora acidiphila TaxID=2567942 RepID=A0A540W9U7_9ACTN|nr:peptidoglycan recognition protein [Kitasatospora acidiphila]TQF05164.1 N-acetylmuramoyl-L-alanine amidase [Kitasatospora acidiphila]